MVGSQIKVALGNLHSRLNRALLLAGKEGRALDLCRGLASKGWIITGLIGALAFFLVAGISPLNVINVAWLYERPDTATAQIGWSFYRHSSWSDPIALNPRYGIDFSGSILFSDAIPILAIPAKAVSLILPEPFQYFGWWAFASFVLQGIFGWLLISRATQNPVARILGGWLIVFTPLYCMRLVDPSATHISLTAHWIILAALALCLPPHPRRPGLWWGILLAIVVFVHAYVMAMVATLWCADLIRRALLDFRKVWIEPFAIAGLVGGMAVLSGVYAGPLGEFQGGFGYYKLNVLSFIDSNGWSYLLPDIHNWSGDYEGFAFLGLGGLLLGLVATWSLPAVLRTHPPDLKYVPLVVLIAGMCLFALSQNVTIATKNIWISWPEPLRMLGELFRSTGRFVWPFYYFLFFAGVLVASRRLSPGVFNIVLGLAAIVQTVDTVPGWTRHRAYLDRNGTHYGNALTSPFWSEAAKRYKAVRLAPHPPYRHPRFREIASFAEANGMWTDAAYLSRTSSAGTQASQVRIEQAISTGIWPRDTLFILDEEIARRASATYDHTRDFVARVDGLVVLAPAWEGCSGCGATRLKE